MGIKGLRSFERKSQLPSAPWFPVWFMFAQASWLRRRFVILVRPGCAWLLQHRPDQLNETTCHIDLTSSCTTGYPSG